MAYNQLEIRSFQGLFLQQNSFQVPDGAMEIASRVVIRSDEVITKTNGLYEYWRPDGISPLDEIRATKVFQGKLIGFFSTGLGYFTETYPFGGTFNAVGVLTELESTVPLSFQYGMDSSLQNKNLYFVADQGVFKLESFDGKALRSGIPSGLGLQYTAEAVGNGILSENSQTGFRVVFGRRDSNGNLLLGAPSDVITIGVPAKISGLTYTVTAGVCEVIITTDYDVYLAIQRDGLVIGQQIIVSGTGNADIDGVRTVTAISGRLIGSVLSYYLQFNTAAANGTASNLAFELSFIPTITADIPGEIENTDENWFAQFYRTSSSIAVTAAPEPNFRLVSEKSIAASDITLKEISFRDDVNSFLLGAELYTNPNTREGENSGNYPPPKAKYICPFKEYMCFGNVQTIPRLQLQLVNALVLSSEVDLIFKLDLTEEKYRAVNSGSPGDPGYYYPFVGPMPRYSTGTNSINVFVGTPDNPHQFPVGTKIFVSDGAGLVPIGIYTAISVTSEILTISVPGVTIADDLTITILSVPDGSGEAFLYQGRPVGGILLQDLLLTDAEWVEQVAKALCKSINLNSSIINANYTSQFDDFPGKMSISSKDFTNAIFVRYSAVPSKPAFIQNIPDSFITGIQCYSESDILPNSIFMSKIGEPEAVPVVNEFPVGTVNAAIVGLFPLKDSLIVLKEDGVYKIIGDIFSQMQSVAVDLTIEFTSMMAQSAAVINNTVVAFCNQGVVQITENAVQVISRRIEDVIQPLIGRDLSTTFLFGHESDRLFYVQTSGLNPGEPDTTWIYNVLNQSWTSTPDVFRQLSLGTRNELVGIRLDADLDKNTLWYQRKTNTRVDFCGQYVIGDISIDPMDQSKGTFSITGGNIAVPAVGDVILSQNIFNRIIEVTPDGGDYILTFAQSTAIASGSPVEVTLYKAYESIVKMAPFHAGQVGRTKHFAQMQLHLRQQVITDLSIEYAGAFYGSSEVTNWKSLSVSSAGAQGWGFSPWGLFPWGLVDGSNIVAGTEPASIIRTYVPRFAARNTFIQAVFKHQCAGQPMMIQALSFSVHGYGERTSR